MQVTTTAAEPWGPPKIPKEDPAPEKGFWVRGVDPIDTDKDEEHPI